MTAPFPFRPHQALGRCYCGRTHSIEDAIALNEGLCKCGYPHEDYCGGELCDLAVEA